MTQKGTVIAYLVFSVSVFAAAIFLGNANGVFTYTQSFYIIVLAFTSYYSLVCIFMIDQINKDAKKYIEDMEEFAKIQESILKQLEEDTKKSLLDRYPVPTASRKH